MDFCEPREASIIPYRSAEKEALAEDSSEPQAFAVVCLSAWEDAKLKIHTKEFTKTTVQLSSLKLEHPCAVPPP